MSTISQQVAESHAGSDTKLPGEATPVFASERAELDPVEPEFNVTVGEPLPERELLRIDGTSTFIIPSTTVVEASGVVTLMHAHPNYTKRTEDDQILAALSSRQLALVQEARSMVQTKPLPVCAGVKGSYSVSRSRR